MSVKERKDWKESLRNIKLQLDLLKPTLRFGLSWVPVSSIAEQYYCEQKVDLEYKFGEVTKKEKDEGSKLHEEILAMKVVDIETIIGKIESDPLLICSFPVLASFNDIVIVGKPDGITFLNSRLTYIIELKTTARNVDALWDSEKVQVDVYSYALEEMGFDCSNLTSLILKIDRNINKRVRKIILHTITYLIRNKVPLSNLELFLKSKGIKIRIHQRKYIREEAIKTITWAKDYWTMKREAKPTSKLGKCKICVFANSCSSKSVIF